VVNNYKQAGVCLNKTISPRKHLFIEDKAIPFAAQFERSRSRGVSISLSRLVHLEADVFNESSILYTFLYPPALEPLQMAAV